MQPNMDPSMISSPAPPPPPPPSYAAATQEMTYGGGYPSQHQHHGHMQQQVIHSPTRRGPPVDGDGFSESIDPAKYKTRLCQAFMMGNQCTFGGRCAFAHGHNELRQPPASPSQAPPPPPSYQDFTHHHHSGQSSPLHSRPQTPRGAGAPPSSSADVLMSPTRMMHPRNSLPGSPVTAGDQMGFPGSGQRFRNEPYSPTGFVIHGQQEGGESK